MASSFLTPPNRYSLSDAVIGSVVQRAGPLYSRLGFTDESDSRAVQSYTKPRHTFSVGHADSYSPDALPSKRTDKYQPKCLIGQKRLPDLDSLADITTKRPVNMVQVIAEREQEQLPPQPVLRRKMRVSASRRERCRINQARYRKRQRKHAEDLDEGIRKVQEEIENLEAQRQKILRCAPTNESVWVVATEYFRLFRYGYMTPMEVLESPAPSSLASGGINAKRFQRPEQSHAQLDFLKATMASDVTDGSVCGAEALLEHWKLLSVNCGNVQVQVKRLEQVAADCLLASTTTSVTLTENTLRGVFPHLVVDQDTNDDKETVSKPLSLAQKLLNQRLVLRGSVRFDWDASTGRVVRLESMMDLLTPMLRLLGSLEDVATVFDKALVTLEGNFMKTEKASDSSDVSN